MIVELLGSTVGMLVQASPYILFGLLVAGLVHVLVPEALVLRWMGHAGLAGVVRAAGIGIPLPVCSCGVVPITLALRRKGASEPAAKSFLITTPESSIDSIFLTWGMMGPVMAVARPIAAFVTALIGGVLSIAYGKPPEPAHRPDERDHHHGHDHHVTYAHGDRARETLRRWLRRPAAPDLEPGRGVWPDVLRPALRYGFVELLDDLAFWLLIGIALAGVLAAALPADLASGGLGSGIGPMLLLLVTGVPLYMCASASTPIAAALLAKGVSPGAALVFLLAGPATNAATILLLASTFGRRFVRLYLISVVVGALAAGLTLDALVRAGGLSADSLAPATGQDVGGWSLLAAVILVGLCAWRLARGAWREGVGELRRAGARLGHVLPSLRRLSRRGWTAAGAVLVLAAYLATGVRTLGPEERGYGFLLGSLRWTDLGPGIHYLPPPPFATLDRWRVDYPRKADVGFRSDLSLLASRRDLTRRADTGEWHSPVAAMNADPVQATYLTADENLVEMSFTVHFGLAQPTRFFYGVDTSQPLVTRYGEAVARELIAGLPLDALLTDLRATTEGALVEALQSRLDAIRSGVRVDAVRIVDIHPPGAAVFSFRDVSSARNDRETRIHLAHETEAWEIPSARGQAVRLEANAEADATRARLEAVGRRDAFLARQEKARHHAEIVRHLLRVEAAERSLRDREKILLPPGRGGTGITLWREAPPPPPEEDF